MYYRQPFEGEYPISQGYGGTDTSAFHTGIDYACPTGTQILASEAGTVVFAGWDNTGYGNCVIIQHSDGNATLYAHLSQIYVKVGQKVSRSQVIGLSGSTGNSTGSHLHFEARHSWNDYKSHFDPMDLPLHSSIEQPNTGTGTVTPTPPVAPAPPLKEADEFSRGEVLDITAPWGAKGYRNANFSSFDVYPQGTKVLYTGETKEHNGYTYMLCYPLEYTSWIAVNDHDCQIIDKP